MDITSEHSGFPSQTATLSEIGGALTASTTYSTVTAGNPAHTKGSWTEVIASTSGRAVSLTLSIFYAAGDGLVDIGVGAAASETVLIPDIMVGTAGFRAPNPQTFFCNIPKGTRISARWQATGASTTLPLGITICYGAPAPQQFGSLSYPIKSTISFESAGAVSATSQGTVITASASTNTKGSWTELISSTSRKTFAVVINLRRPGGTDHRYLFDIGTGVADSEVVLIGNLGQEASTTNWMTVWHFPITIPPGTRIAARTQSHVASSAIKLAMTLMEVD